MQEKNIINVLQDEFIEYAGDILINNLPSIDGLLPVNRKVIWGLYKNGVTHNKPFIKMLRASSMAMVYYIFGDLPLTEAMKNMGNNSVNYFYLEPKGSFGDKQRKEGVGASPRYIECKLSKYSESMLAGVNKNNVPMKRNFDNTEYEPIILPSIIPNILTNTGQSIAVGEASKIPSHNLTEVCHSFISYIKTSDIDKSIEILKGADFSLGGQILYNKNDFEKIYKTGKGSFTLIGKYTYDEKENKISVVEVPYETYIEDIDSKIRDCYDKGLFKEIVDIHDGTDKNGIRLDIYLKKNTNIRQFIAKLRKYTPYESKFSCNFTILDLDGKTPVLMSLEKIIIRWVKHRVNCIKNETQFDIQKNKEELNKLYGLKIINSDLDRAISIIRESKSEKIAIENLISYFKLNDKQAEYISTIRLVNINKEWISNRISNIENLEKSNVDLQNYYGSEELIKKTIINQLQEVIKEYGKPRKTEVLYEEDIEEVSKIDVIPEYNCRIYLSEQGYFKKLLKATDIASLKTKEDDKIIQELPSSNKSMLMFITNKANRYKIPCYELEICNSPSKSLGEYLPNIIDLEQDEKVIKIVSLEDELKANGFIISVFENGKIAKVDIKSFVSANKKLQNCYSTESKLLDIVYTEEDLDILMISSEGKGLIINSSDLGEAKKSKNSQGNQAMNLGELEENKVIACVIKPNQSLHFTLVTEKGKSKEFILDDVAPTNKSSESRTLAQYITGKARNMGSFIINTRTNNDRVKEVII